MNRTQRQRELNQAFSVLPTFTPLLDDYRIFHINQATSPTLLHNLIRLAQRTTSFTLDTEHDCNTHAPALLQIEFICDCPVILLVETCHLPSPNTLSFWLIKSLLKVVLQSGNTLYAWGDLTSELASFLGTELVSWSTVQQVKSVDVQKVFKRWYNRILPHTCGLPAFNEDHPACACNYRPVKDKNNHWSLQKAIVHTCNQFLDKSRTRSPWSQRLTSRAYHCYATLRNKDAKTRFEQRILYATNDCLAVTKLCMVIALNWTQEHLQQFRQTSN